jgi:hypothetical protein
MGRAERNFREAFERLKQRKSVRLPKGARVTKNNVAREAGTVPSALRRDRFPELVDDIQTWIDEHREDESQKTTRQKALAQRNRNRDLRQKIRSLEAQRDDALGKLVSAESRIVELTVENQRLQALSPTTNVSPIRRWE